MSASHRSLALVFALLGFGALAARAGVVQPILEYVVDNPNGTYTAFFGYQNNSATAVQIPLGDGNRLVGGASISPGLPTRFEPGRQRAVFSVVFPSVGLTWFLDGLTSVALPNRRPVVTLTLPRFDQAPVAPATLQLSATAYDLDRFGAVARVEFYRNGTKIGEDTTAPYTCAVADLGPGIHEFTACAFDDTGAPSLLTAPQSVVVAAAPFVPRLPVVARFELSEGYTSGPLNRQRGWTADAGVTVTDTVAASGSRAVALPGGAVVSTARASFSGGPVLPVVFVDQFLSTAASSNVAQATQVDVAGVGRLALAGSGRVGQVLALWGNGTGTGVWQPVGSELALESNGAPRGWLRWTMRADFLRRRYDVFLQGTLVAIDLPFAQTSATQVSQIVWTGRAGTPSFFDDLYAGAENPVFADADRDGMPDPWEVLFGLVVDRDDRDADADGDGLSNVREYLLGTKPNSSDSDGDGMPDGWEQRSGLNPLANEALGDADQDGVSNLYEYLQGRHPRRGVVADTAGAVQLRVHRPRS